MLNPTDRHIILASNSPRRRALLQLIAPVFDIAETRDVDETYPAAMAGEKVPEYLSRLKASAYNDIFERGNKDVVLITADTVVLLDDKILGKPHSEDEAFEMLKHLSGREHRVVTGVTLKSSDKTVTFSNATKVRFDSLTDDEIRGYIKEFRPFDKAGSYGIQEWIGGRGIIGIEGCFYNVMGLPLNDLYNHLRHF